MDKNKATIENNKRMKILIADDDMVSRKLLSTVLGKWGYDPVVVSDGLQALHLLRRQDAPTLVILDWNMPGLEGPEVCHRVRKLETPLPPYIIMLTAKDDKEDIVKALDAGANDFVSKPFNHEELKARVGVGQRMVNIQSDLHEARQAMEYEAMYDALTDIFNRRAILNLLQKEVERSSRTGALLSIGLCDIDHFKMINDTHGHQVGDDVLHGLVEILKNNLRSYDAIGRYGGEEFLIIAPDTSGASEKSLYSRLCSTIADTPISTRKGDINVTLSIGVAGSLDLNTVDKLLAKADTALYQAKDRGRNCVVYTDKEN